MRRLLGGFIRHHADANRGGSGPPLLGRRDVGPDVRVVHVDPGRARGDAVEAERRADLLARIPNGLAVLLVQNNTGRSLDVRRADHGGLHVADLGHDLLDGRGLDPPVLFITPAVHRPRLHHVHLVVALAHALEELGPAVGEVAVADHHHVALVAEGARGGLHGVRARAGQHDGVLRVVGVRERRVEVVHDLCGNQPVN